MNGIKCPVCKSTNVEHRERRQHNGILGPGGYSVIVDEYWSCLNCGVRFDLIEKKDEKS